jgi:hypothetical protein
MHISSEISPWRFEIDFRGALHTPPVIIDAAYVHPSCTLFLISLGTICSGPIFFPKRNPRRVCEYIRSVRRWLGAPDELLFCCSVHASTLHLGLSFKSFHSPSETIREVMGAWFPNTRWASQLEDGGSVFKAIEDCEIFRIRVVWWRGWFSGLRPFMRSPSEVQSLTNQDFE